jgi:hypothetical protein
LQQATSTDFVHLAMDPVAAVGSARESPSFDVPFARPGSLRACGVLIVIRAGRDEDHNRLRVERLLTYRSLSLLL